VVELENGIQLGVGRQGTAEGPAAASDVPEKDQSLFIRFLHIVLHFLNLMTSLLKYFSPEDDLRMKKIVYRLVKMRPLGSQGHTLLHSVCSKDRQRIGKFPDGCCALEVAKLLIEVGADVSATDDNGDTPLHCAARLKPLKPDLIRFLLQSGAHWDQKNAKSQIPMECNPFWQNRSVLMRDIFSYMENVSLQCLSAQAVVKYGIPYQGGLLPRKLESFVELH